MAISRIIKGDITRCLSTFPVIAITGPRQSGKTTMLKEMFPEYAYTNMENIEQRSFAESDVVGFFKTYSGKLIIDEVQKVPELFSYIQYLVDETKQMGQIIISGSQNFQLIERISQSLAGRVAIFQLFPFDIEEMKSGGLLPDQFEKHLIKGSYPSVHDRNISPKDFYANYLKTYVERDIVTLVNIREINNFRKFIGLCAARCAQILNLNSLANECGISQPTAKSWLALLESSFITFTLKPYTSNHNKRLIKSPKLFFYDTGLVSHLLRISDPVKLQAMSLKGHLFENMIVSEYHKHNEHSGVPYDFYFWRDSEGHEVDLIRLGENGQKDIIEIKATSTITKELLDGLDYYHSLVDTDSITNKIIVYAGGSTSTRFGAEIVSWKDICTI